MSSAVPAAPDPDAPVARWLAEPRRAPCRPSMGLREHTRDRQPCYAPDRSAGGGSDASRRLCRRCPMAARSGVLRRGRGCEGGPVHSAGRVAGTSRPPAPDAGVLACARPAERLCRRPRPGGSAGLPQVPCAPSAASESEACGGSRRWGTRWPELVCHGDAALSASRGAPARAPTPVPLPRDRCPHIAVVSRILWKFPGGALRACEGSVFQAARSRSIGSMG